MAGAADPATLSPPAVSASGLAHRYGACRALDGVDLQVPTGALFGVIGPDGVGKSTLLGLVSGARRLQQGRIEVLGNDLRRGSERRRALAALAYMPEGLGASLYPELSVGENVAFFARLFRVPRARVKGRVARLLDVTGLSEAADRRARHLSGGMKQKLGLCCSLVHDPRLLILDEPTTGVDPLSRIRFWRLLSHLRSEKPDLTVVVATGYMEEAESFDDLVLLHRGRVLARGSAGALCERTVSRSLEEAYAKLLEDAGPGPAERESAGTSHGSAAAPQADEAGVAGTPPISLEARSLTRRFGTVLAVDSVSFSVERGEIFGFLGPNGCGKTTTLKMLTGILPPSDGRAWLLGQPVEASSIEQRRHCGYMSQSFSLYGELTVGENLRLYGRLLDVARKTLRSRSEALAERFGLSSLLDTRARELPLGVRQRLALATALVHEPAILVLDEPTSGVDPLAREIFWQTIEHLARDGGVTVLVSTHYLTEAERCDRVALMNAGRILACDAPASLARTGAEATLESAFVDLIRADERRGAGLERRP